MFRIFDYKPVHDLPYIPMCRHIICSLGHIVISSGHYAIFIYNLISYLIYIFAMIHIGKLVIVFKPFSTQCINNYIPLSIKLHTKNKSFNLLSSLPFSMLYLQCSLKCDTF